jgi:hypothetical protein
MGQIAEWTPPEKPDAHAILREAVDDRRAGHYAIALAKQLWFHENALNYDGGLVGVRLSFALGYWNQLAKVYPPASKALRSARDAAELEFHQRGLDFSAFQDFAALNRVLDETERTVAAFRIADQTDRNEAKAIFRVALPSLILHREYILCGNYLEPKTDLELAVEIHRMRQRCEAEFSIAEGDSSSRHRNLFVQEISTLVALLVQNERPDDARWLAEWAQKTVDDVGFSIQLASAMAGNVPSNSTRV